METRTPARPIVPPGALRDGPAGPDTSEFDLDDFLTNRILHLARALDRQAKRTYGESFGLSLIEWRIIAKLGPKGRTTANRLASGMHYDKGQVSRAVAALVGAGYLSREPDQEDSRSAILRLTREGRRFHKELMAFGRERQRRLLTILTPDQRKSLYEIVAVLSASLQAEVGDEPASYDHGG